MGLLRRLALIVAVSLLAVPRTVHADAPRRASEAARRAPATPSSRSVRPTGTEVRREPAQTPRTRVTKRGSKNAAAARPRRRPPCLAPAVTVVRTVAGTRESERVSLTRCNGTPNRDALDLLSILARPHGTDRPSARAIERYHAPPPPPRARGTKRGRSAQRATAPRPDPALVVPGIRRVHIGLLARLQTLANTFPGKPIEIVSGYRPDERESSRHHHARALDIRIPGVRRERLRDAARRLPATGVGYYPNNVFVHIDVREERGYWVDRSGPGEPADYGTWPPTPREREETRARVLANVESTLNALRRPERDSVIDDVSRGEDVVLERERP